MRAQASHGVSVSGPRLPIPPTLRNGQARRDRLRGAATPIVQELESRTMFSASLLKDINPSLADADPSGFVASGNTLYFTANVGTNAYQAWKTDGTAAGTTPLTNLTPGGPGAFFTGVDVNGSLYFFSQPGEEKEAYPPEGLWRTDGTSAGSVLLGTFDGASNLTNVNGTAYFTAYSAVGGAPEELFKSDGTPAGTVLVKSFDFTGGPSELTSLDGTLYFAVGSVLWKTDGTDAGTVPVIDTGLGIRSMTAVNGHLFIEAASNPIGNTLWVSDGTAAQPSELGTFAYPIGAWTTFGGELYFSATDLNQVSGLWKSNGTAAGTSLVRSIPIYNQCFQPGQFAVAGETLYFEISNPSTNTTDLWRSDGTTAGTTVDDEILGNASLGSQLGSLDGILYFGATDGIHGKQLWRSDGTAAGTYQLDQINTTGAGSGITNNGSVAVDGETFFFAAGRLWKSDGTADRTVLVSDVQGSNLMEANGTVYFAGPGSASASTGIWKSDGTAAGTMRIADVPPLVWNSPSVAVGNFLYFDSYTGGINDGLTLFRTDGTAAGTTAVMDVSPALALNSVVSMANVDGTLFFTTIDASSHVQLYKIRPTGGTPVLVGSFAGKNIAPTDLTALSGNAYLVADDGIHGAAMWVAPAFGSIAAPYIVWNPSYEAPTDLFAFDGAIYATVGEVDSSVDRFYTLGGVYHYDPATRLTQQIYSGVPTDFISAGGKLFFQEEHGYMQGDPYLLYATDGTAAGTHLVDANLGLPGLYETTMATAANGLLYFVANDGTHGNQLWQTDGVTTTLADPSEAANGWTPNLLIGQTTGGLVFVATDLAHGSEPWDLPLAGIANGGFESPAVGAGTFGSFAYDPSGSAWTFAGAAGISGNASGFTAQNADAPDGSQVAFLQGANSTITQSVTLAAGTYTIDFQAAQRVQWQYGLEDFEVLVDGNIVGTFQPAAGGAYASYQTGAFAVSDGLHTITFKGLDAAGGDNTAFIDAVSATVTPPVLADAGFESPNVGSGTESSFTYDPPGNGWQFAGKAGISGNGSGFTALNPNAPEGTQVGFLQFANSSITQVVDLSAGACSLSFQAAQRVQWQSGRQDFEVLIDGKLVGTYNPPASGAYTSYTTASITVAAGQHTIEFLGLDSADGDNTALIDNVQVLATTQMPAQPADAGFESPSVGSGSYGAFAYDPTGTPWTFAGQSGISGNGSGFTALNANAPEGAQVAFLQGAGSSITQTVTLAAGTYTIDFQAAQRVQWQYGLQDFELLVDGTVYGHFTPAAGAAYTQLSTTPISLGDGPHTITFEGLDTAGGDNTVFIDAVQIDNIFH